MSKNGPSKEDLDKYHQWFAIECNNAAWTLACKERSPDEDLEFLNAAHSAMLHWSAVGTELHKMRALSLLAHAHASLGIGSTSLAWASTCTDFFTNRETEDWELAFTHMIHAQAAAASGNAQMHAEHYGLAGAIIDRMPDGEDKNIVLASWVFIPKP